ncbi:OLC1v1009424C2 [Oldenlandia corymbosa var. corymbosa]|uniref:OLC1v1009424C2 n=1 Tax=Oldenlandia corymbosa var. corymbosa TaxID=529605 RepID=A0AAV1DPG4_OLDCO|nr:OLC1v1009424C2 [Oldenlandia corymbosa var. corymbosa]
MDRITAKIQSPSWPFGAVPAFSRPPAPRGAAGKGGGGKGRKPAGLTADDALCYLTEVQTAFKDKKEKYQMFIDIMKDFHNQRIDSKAVLTKVKAVFKHHPALIHGFNAFLPRGYEITLKGGARVPRKEKLDFEDALAFVHKVKKRFNGKGHVYFIFLDLLHLHRQGLKDMHELYPEIAALLKYHPDLLHQFTRFLPQGESGESGLPAKFLRQKTHKFRVHTSSIPSFEVT